MTGEREERPSPLSAVPDDKAEAPEGRGPLFEGLDLRPPPPGPPPRRALRRSDVHGGAYVDGAGIPDRVGVRLQRLYQQLTTSQSQREEAALDDRLTKRRHVTRTNLVAVVSPKGGVGKTTSSFVVGDMLASRPKLRVLVVDTNPDFGTLGKLAPDSHASDHQLTDVIGQIDRIRSAAELDPFLASTPTGLHLLAAPQRPELMEAMSPEAYGQLLTFLGRFYHVIVLDLGTGLTDPLAQFALERADQAIVVAHPTWVTMSTVLDALDYVLKRLGGHQLTMALNQAPKGAAVRPLEAKLANNSLSRQVTIPKDERLAEMLDHGTYVAEQLPRRTRVAIKHLALAVADQLV
ncbi:MAG: AAA family ATPase [Actinomycetota bacterium]|nr:AAA family ATPase [Actinomycetota bacterium]